MGAGIELQVWGLPPVSLNSPHNLRTFFAAQHASSTTVTIFPPLPSGGYTAARQEIVDLLRQKARPYLCDVHACVLLPYLSVLPVLGR